MSAMSSFDISGNCMRRPKGAQLSHGNLAANTLQVDAWADLGVELVVDVFHSPRIPSVAEMAELIRAALRNVPVEWMS